MAAAGVASSFQRVSQQGVGAPAMILALLAMMVIPLPPFALDIFFTFSIALALIVLLVGVYVLRPLDFGIFPAVLLITTLFRLALNIASTRVVLLEGHTGTGAAGKVIEAFGEFVIGGNYAVGLVVFSILVIINFVVVTKGAGRIAEVTARFTLDALPGKQMAIDADMNAGMLTQEEARERRDEVRREADFYGSMDGASKFVRGDAVAGILILFINIIGGLTIGMVQHELPLSEAVRNYTLLTIGDGLVAQIPALLISSSAAIIVTRVSGQQELGKQAVGQLFGNPKILFITSGILGSMGIIPGMPNFAFLTLAIAIGGLGYYKLTASQKPLEQEESVEEEEVPAEMRDLSWDDVRPVDVIGLEVGYRLIPLVDRNQNGELMSRIKGVRRKLSQELGFLVQPVHIRDNLDLGPNSYRIAINGVTAGAAEIYPDLFLAINPGQVYGEIEGIKGIDPAFGLEAVWIDAANREQSQTLGYTVVDPSTVVATHLSQIIQNNAFQLLGHEEVQKMLDVLAKTAPKLVEDLVPKLLPLGSVLTVLQNLLEEKVPIRDMRTIAETLAAQASKSQEPVMLTMAVRSALKQAIVQNINGMDPELVVMTLDPGLEQLLLQSIQGSDGGDAGIEPGLADTLFQSLRENVQQVELSGKPAVLIISPVLREWLAKLVKHSIPTLHVLSYNEVPDDKQIKVVATLGEALPAA
jgi:flagellar biosynthesis protein FlhA